MSSVTNSTTFFQNGNAAQFEFALALYPAALKVKAENRGAGKKPEKLIRLDDWFQNTLPKLIAKRGKDAHLLHEEMCQTMEWKQTRGKSYPQLTHLIKINTPRAVMVETKKAFRKLPNMEAALNALTNLKGVGITMASALLAAAVPDQAPFMADECLNAIPEFENIDYTAKEYLKFVELIQAKQERLNKEYEGKSNGTGGGEENGTTGEEKAAKEAKKWSAHSVELALWAYSVAFDLQPELLKDMPESNGVVAAAPIASATNGNAADTEDENSQNGVPSDESNLDSESASKDAPLITNGNSLDGVDSENGTNQEAAEPAEPIIATVGGGAVPSDSLDDCAKSGDSLDGPPPPATTVEATAAAVATLCTADSNEITTALVDSDSQSSNSQKRPLYCNDDNSEEQPELSAPKLIKL